jgi:hypothetical protein
MLEFKENINTVFYEDGCIEPQVDCYSKEIEVTHSADSTITIDGKRYMVSELKRIIKNNELFIKVNKDFIKKIVEAKV